MSQDREARCLRCGNIWHPYVENPKWCPKCNSPYWNQEKKKFKKIQK